MRAVMSATAFSPARRTMSCTSARRAQRSQRHRVSRRKTSSRVRSGNMVLLRSSWALSWPGNDEGEVDIPPPLSFRIWSLAVLGPSRSLIRRVGVMPADAPSFFSLRLLCGLLGRYDRYESSALFRQESDASISGGKEGMILAHADVHARMPFRAALTNNDVARHDLLIAELL